MSVLAFLAIESYSQDKFMFLNELYITFSDTKIQ